MRLDFWTDEAVAELRKLWAEGYSATSIAPKVGKTRNAVLGKLHRMNEPTPANKRQVFVRQVPGLRGATVRHIRPSYLKKPPTFTPGQVVATPVVRLMVRKPRVAEMSKTELRAMLTRAVQNTAALS
jgi:hypothetical protein